MVEYNLVLIIPTAVKLDEHIASMKAVCLYFFQSVNLLCCQPTWMGLTGLCNKVFTVFLKDLLGSHLLCLSIIFGSASHEIQD